MSEPRVYGWAILTAQGTVQELCFSEPTKEH